MPVTTARQYFSRPNMTFKITVMPINPVNLDMMTGEAEAIFRIIRNLNPRDESDFNISKSDNIVKMLLEEHKICYTCCNNYWYCNTFWGCSRTYEYYACFGN